MCSRDSGCATEFLKCHFFRILHFFQNFWVPPNFSNVPFFPAPVWNIIWTSRVSRISHMSIFSRISYFDILTMNSKVKLHKQKSGAHKGLTVSEEPMLQDVCLWTPKLQFPLFPRNPKNRQTDGRTFGKKMKNWSLKPKSRLPEFLVGAKLIFRI